MGELREPLRELTACGLPEALEVMGEESGGCVVMDTHEKIPVSTRKKDNILNYLGKL